MTSTRSLLAQKAGETHISIGESWDADEMFPYRLLYIFSLSPPPPLPQQALWLFIYSASHRYHCWSKQ